MTSTRTNSANTLREIRQNVVADSALFSERLKPEADVPGAAGYSDLFMEACCDSVVRSSDGADHRVSGSASGAADNSDSGETKVLNAVRLGIEYIFEGYLLHYGESRLLGPDDDNHFHLLAGDYMYARGLEAIALLDDLACIRALAELVQVCSFIHCEKLDPGLAAKAWAVTALGLAWRVSSGGAASVAAMPDFGKLDKLEGMLEELMAAGRDGSAGHGTSGGGANSSGSPANASLRERFSSIEAEFFHKD